MNVKVADIQKMPHCEKPCRRCGHTYERGCAGHDPEGRRKKISWADAFKKVGR